MFQLHKEGVAHLDLKSENFFCKWIDATCEATPQILLGDFGEAIDVELDPVERGAGTVEFRAPV